MIIATALLALFLNLPSPALADLEKGRDFMEAGNFGKALQQFQPLARSGNADAEELIGVMYAMGLGVARDDIRAFEWYLRASMKGHPGAQSGVAWYYEIGRACPLATLSGLVCGTCCRPSVVIPMRQFLKTRL